MIATTACVSIATLGFSKGSLPAWMPPLWSDTSALIRDSLLVVGPLVTAIGAALGTRRHTIAIGPLVARGWGEVARSQIVPVAVAVVLGSILGAAPSALDATRSSTGGQIQFLVVLSGLTTCVAFLLGGYAAGVAWTNRIVVALAPVMAVLIIVLPVWATTAMAGPNGTGPTLNVIAPVWADYGAGPGRIESLSGSIQRTVFFTLLGLAFYAVVLVVGEASYDPRRRIGLAWFALPLAFGFVLTVTQPTLVVATSETSCQTAQTGVLLCAPQAIEDILPAMVRGADSIIDPFGTGALDLNVPLTDVVSVAILADEASVESYAAVATARAVAGMTACEYLSEDGREISVGGDLVEAYDRSRNLAAVLALRAGVDQTIVDQNLFVSDPRYVSELLALPESELQDHVSTKTDALRNCTT